MLAPKPSTCSVVGIGASAGGLDAVRRLLAALPADAPFAVVVVQHLDPSIRSQLAEIMDRVCELRVVRAKSGDALVAGTVFVVPEGREAFLAQGRLRLRRRATTCAEPIDTFFSSLAAHSEASGCGVLLSGNGSDGALGLREIRGAGGITFAQDPSTAEYPGMPSSAIEAGDCDFVGSPEEIATDLLIHVRHSGFGGAPIKTRQTKAGAQREEHALARIVALVRADSGMDFSGYKSTTVVRRVSRRAMLRDANSIEAYCAIVEDNPEELSALVDDLLINVTQFFRDPEVFEALKARVFPEILKAKSDADTLRIWAVGCSTGEEVYSLLITALEAVDESPVKPKITVFGTDASEHAVKRARAGVYPSSICASVSPERLAKYFVRTDAGFEIDRALRDMCVFARQDVTKDTPFSRLDLVSLRNVLIYMDQPLQRQVLAVAHFALAPDGFLLLGTSETPETEPRLFAAFDKANHVYGRQDVASRLPLDVANSTRSSIDALSVSTAPLAYGDEILDPHAAANEMALLVYAPPRVVVDVNGHILHFFGDTAPYLEHAAGKATLDINEMAHAGLALELKEALETAKAIDSRAAREATFVSAGAKRRVSIEATPLPSTPGQRLLLVAFRDLSTAAETGLPSPATSEDLSRLYESREQRVRGELGALRGRLRTISEEKEQVNQSLRSANEEIRSSNEELQSINEELETAKEELQSANEELITVNDELRQSNRELGLTNDDLTNFSSSIDVPVLMLDRSLRVRRFTPQAQRVVRIEETDVGRLLEHLRLRVDVADLPRIAAEVIESEEPQQLDTQDDDGCWYALSVRPYRSAEGVVDGVVLAFVDVDEPKRNAERFERRARLTEALTAIDADVASTMHFDEIMQRALDEGAAALGADAGAIEVREGDEWVLRYQNGFSADELGLRLRDADAPNATAAARTREPVMVADTAAEEGGQVGFVKEHALKSALAVPLIVRDSVMGCVVFYHRLIARPFSAEEIDFGRRLGTSVSLALENSRRLQAEHAAVRRAEALNAINEIIRSAITPQDLLGRLVGEVSEVAGADKCLVIEVRDGDYVITHVRDVQTDLLGKVQSAEYFPAFASAAREHCPVLIGDTWTDSRTNKEFVVPHGLRAFQLLPLTVDKTVVAVLALAFDQPRAFDADDEAFSLRLCTAMSVALKNALLYESEVRAREEAKRELETTSLLLRVADTLASPEDLSARLGTLAELVSSVLVHERVVIDLWDDGAQLVRVVATHGGPAPVKDVFAWDELSQPAREAIEHGRSAVIDYGRESASVQDLSEPAGFRLAVAMPMVFAGRTVGLILADQPAESLEFSAREIQLLDSIAGQAAIAVENARLFEAEVEAQLRVNEELEMTSALLEAANAVSGWLDLESVVRGLARTVLKSTSHSRIAVDLWDEAAREIIVVASEGDRPYEVGSRWAIDKMSVAARAAIFEARMSVWDFDAMVATDRGAAVPVYRSHVGLYVPLVSRGVVVGLLILDDPGTRREFSEREIRLVEGISAQAAVAMENARLYQAELEARRRVETLQRIAEFSASSLQLGEVVDNAVAYLAQNLDVDAVTFWTLDKERAALFPLTGVGFPIEFFDDFASGVSLDAPFEIARAVAHRAPVVRSADDIDQIPAPVRAAYEKFGVPLGALLVVPVCNRTQTFGAITLAWKQPRNLTDAEVAFFVSAADELAMAADNARLFESELEARQQATRELETTSLLLETASTLSTWADVDGALESLARILLESTVQERVTLNLWDEERQVLRTVVSAGTASMAPGSFPAEVLSAQIKAVIATKKTAVVDYDKPPKGRTAKLAADRAIHVGLLIPIVFQKRVLGVIGVDSPGERREFEPREIERLEAVAAQAAVAIENARLFEAAQAELFRATVLKEVAAIGAATLDVRQLAQLALTTLQRLLGAQSGTLYVIDESEGCLRNMANFGMPKKAMAPYLEVPLDSDTTSVRVMRAARAVMHDSPDTKESGERVTRVIGIPDTRWIHLPILIEDRVIGTLGLSFAELRPFAPAELELYGAAAEVIGVSLEKAMLVEALDSSSQRVTQILGSISDGFYALDREWRFTYANAEAGRMIGTRCEGVIGRTIGEVTGSTEIQRVQQEMMGPAMFDRQVVEFERYFTQTEIWADIRAYPSPEGVAVYGRDITERRVAEEALRQARNRADMMATLLDESSQPFCVGNPDGSLGLVNKAFEQLTGYTAEELRDVSWATTLTPPEYAEMEAAMLDQLTRTGEPVRYEKEYLRKDGSRVPIELLVHVARGEDGEPLHFYAFANDLTERKERQRLDRAISEVRTAIGGTLDFSEIVAASLAAGVEVLGVDSAIAFTRGPRGWSVAHSIGMPKSMGAGPFGESDTLIAPVVAAERRPIAINDPLSDIRLSQVLVRRYRVKSILAAPLGVEGAEIGVVEFIHRKRYERFNDTQLAFIAQLARVMTLAIQNAMLYERERKIADTLQDALLMPPEAIAGVETSYLYRAASHSANVGGDFYDVFSLDEHRCAIVVGDVSGKGIEAARLTSLIHDGIRAYSLETTEPVDLLERVNKLVSALTPPEQFATLFLGILDLRNGRLRYCTAGHPAPAIVSARGVSYLVSTGSPVMGAFANAPFAYLESVLARGERLVLFTDGVTEARRGSQLLGEDGLLRILKTMTRTPVAKFPTRLLDKILTFAEGRLRDDTVILCIERTGLHG